MSLRSKLTFGLGFLFLIIFGLAVYNSVNIQQLAKEADRVLRDNYDSLVYCKNMLVALDDMRTAVISGQIGTAPGLTSDRSVQLFQDGKQAFEKNLQAEKNNITEVHEGAYVGELNKYYDDFLNEKAQIEKASKAAASNYNDFMSAYVNVRQRVVEINDLNMQAIERKNLATHQDANKMILSIAAIGAICVVLAFFYFWYFPFYISNTLNYLATRARELLRKIDLGTETQTKDEAIVLLQSIEMLENRLTKGGKSNGGVGIADYSRPQHILANESYIMMSV